MLIAEPLMNRSRTFSPRENSAVQFAFGAVPFIK
jgi:hypothetical protein